MSGLRPCCSHPKSTRFLNLSLISTRAGSTALNFDDGMFCLNAVDCIYGTTYAYIYIYIYMYNTYIQMRLTFYTSMWGSLRLAPITRIEYDFPPFLFHCTDIFQGSNHSIDFLPGTTR